MGAVALEVRVGRGAGVMRWMGIEWEEVKEELEVEGEVDRVGRAFETERRLSTELDIDEEADE